MAEPLNGDTIQFNQKLARDSQMWLSFGGIHEADLDEAGNKTNHVRNSHILINDTGNLVATYRKLHLFNVDTPEIKYGESKIVRAGDEIIPPIDILAGKLGLQICYDMLSSPRNPHLSIGVLLFNRESSTGKSWTDPRPSKIKPSSSQLSK
jgi:predicted amidohydrolase